MSLCIVKTLDGEEIAADIGNDLRTHCETIITLSVDEFTNNTLIDERSVVAVIVTPLMLTCLKDSRNTGINSGLDKIGHKIFLYKGCSGTAVRGIRELVNKCAKNTTAVPEHVELTDDEAHDLAELKLRKMIRGVKKEGTVARPSAKRFILEPDTFTQGSSEVKIILLEDGKRYKAVKVNISTFEGDMTPTRLTEGVWVLKIPDLQPGVHSVTVTDDGSNLGTARLRCETQAQALFSALPEVVRFEPVQLLSRLFNLNEDDFDSEMVDFFTGDRTESWIFFRCLDLILEKGGEKQTCLHFCARYNLPATCKRILERRYKPEARDAKDVNGKTPFDIAQEKGFDKMIQLLGKCEIEDVPKLNSPLRKISFSDPPTPRASSAEEIRQRKSSTVSSEGSIPEDSPFDGTPTTRAQRTYTLPRARSDGVVSSIRSRIHTITHSAPGALQLRDSGNGSSDGSRDTQFQSDGDGISFRRNSGRSRLASEGENRTQTMILESQKLSEPSGHNFQSYTRAEHEYADIDTLVDQKSQTTSSPTNHLFQRYPRADHPYQDIEARPTDRVTLRSPPSESAYSRPWENDQLPVGSMPGFDSDESASTNL